MLIALVTMVIDHAAAGMVPYRSAWYKPLRCVGRLAFPIYAFLIAEGALRTRNAGRYLLRLLVFALLAEVPYDRYFHGKWLEFGNQNILFTLSAGLAAILLFRFTQERWKNSPLHLLGAIGMIAAGAAAHFLHFDYGWQGVALIFAMYHWRTAFKGSNVYPMLLALLMLLLWQDNSIQLFCVLAIVPLCFYNGERGRAVNKYVFYAFYPLHIIALLLIRTYIISGGAL